MTRGALEPTGSSGRSRHGTEHSVAVRALLDGAVDAPDERLVELLAVDLLPHLLRLPELDAAAWDALRARVPELVTALGTPAYAAAVPAQQRVLHQLIGSGDRAAAEQLVRRGGLRLAGRHVDADGCLDYGDLTDLVAGVPAAAFVLADSQTPLRSGIRRVRLGPDGLLVTGWAHLANLPARRQEVTATLVAGNGREVPLASTRHDDESLEEELPPRGPRYDVRPSGLTVVVPLEQVPTGRWSIRLDVRNGRFVRTGTWSRPDAAGAAGRRQSFAAGADRAAVVDEDDEGRLRIVVHPASTTASGVVVDDDDRLVLTGPGEPPAGLVLVRKGDRDEVLLPPEPTGDGWGASTPLSDVLGDDADGRPWTAWALGEDRRSSVRLAAEDNHPWSDPRVMPTCDPKGRLVVRTRSLACSVLDVRSDDEGVEMDLRVAGVEPDDLQVHLEPTTWTGVTPVGELLRSGRDQVTVRFALRQRRWGTVRLLPSGRYPLAVRCAPNGRVVPVAVDPALVDRLPVDVEGPEVRVQVRTGREGLGLGLRLLPPLRPDERGASNLARLREIAHSGRASAPAVFFRTLFGEATDDSALALHRELRRRGSGLRLYWSVQDRSVAVPEGGIGLLEGSEEWHRMLGEAAYVVLNQHEPRWYHKVPGQVMVQTMHGYPYKLMGRDWWDLKDTPADLIASNYRVTRDWDVLVSPSAYATPLLLDAFFDEEGRRNVRVVEEGYPRNDALLAEDAPEVRRRTRAALGIDEDQVAVLYAPTFRDDMRVDETRAESADVLDAHAFVAALGPRHVLLVRGHAYHARSGTEATQGPGVLDVTHHPDVAELCLASDAAVLDYSSLRFDYALLRRPMVFLVPDLDEYHEARPGLVPFAATAPGPHVTTTAEVVEELRDLPGLRTRFGAAVEEMIETFMEKEDGHSAARVVDAVFREAAG